MELTAVETKRHNWEHGGMFRGYETKELREADMMALRAEGFNHFTHFRDVNAPIAMQFSRLHPWDGKQGWKEVLTNPYFYYVDR